MPRADVETRFWAKVDQTGDCWEWTAHKSELGYGTFWMGGRHLKAHRVAYEFIVGPIPEGMTLDHLCRNTSCVNPAHMEPVTLAENVRRMNRARPDPTHCVRGHAFSEHGRIRPDGSRECRPCSNERKRRWKAKQKGEK